MLKCVSNKNGKESNVDVQIFAFCSFILQTVDYVYDIYDEISGCSLRPTGTKAGIVLMNIFFNAFFVSWVVQMLFRCAVNIDLTERFRFFMYLGGSMYVIIAVSALSIMGKLYQWWNQDYAFEWVGLFTVTNVWSVFMMYLHWPYDPSDNQYEEGEIRTLFSNTELHVDVPLDNELVSEQDFAAEETV